MVISHTVVFFLGVACANLYNRDELHSYRDAYEKPMQRIRRYSGNAAIGTLTLGSLWFAVRIVGRGKTSGGTDSTTTCCDSK